MNKKIIFHNFLKHCSNKGLLLLRDDIKFIENGLNKVPYKLVHPTLKHYVFQWNAGMKEETDALKKQSSGRRKANQWFLGYVNGQHR